MTGPKREAPFRVEIDRASTVNVGDQIYTSIRDAVLGGLLTKGARLPSGRDLAIQLGVARGTVRSAYDRLAAENLVVGAGPAGTRVSARIPAAVREDIAFDGPLAGFTRPYSSEPLPFQMGVPANDAFPAKVWARLRARAVRSDALGFTTYADPRGESNLRSEVARHLAISRRIQCHPDQVIITSGYRQALSMTLTALRSHGHTAWIENPGYPLGRRALELFGVHVKPVPVDAEGICVEAGMQRAPDAQLALVSPGQQAPLGVSLSVARRRALLGWASANQAWVIEDDYLGELQIDGRASPALAAGEGAERVVHIGAFSKTLSPALGLGYLVAPPSLTEKFVEVSAVSAPAPNRTTQLALADFLGSGHFLRHLRQMKALYAERRAATLNSLDRAGLSAGRAGLGLVVRLPKGTDDRQIVRKGRERGLALTALQPWYTGPDSESGLLLSVTNMRPEIAKAACDSLLDLIGRETRLRKL